MGLARISFSVYSTNMKVVEEEVILSKLRTECERLGSQKAWAECNGISPQYVTDVLLRRRGPGESILFPLGYKKIVRYERIE
jgi:hypothetical protein